jgi:hypothetical protein
MTDVVNYGLTRLLYILLGKPTVGPAPRCALGRNNRAVQEAVRKYLQVTGFQALLFPQRSPIAHIPENLLVVLYQNTLPCGRLSG